MRSAQAPAQTTPYSDIDLDKMFEGMELLQCLRPMIWYYQSINRSIRHLAGDKNFRDERFLTQMSVDQVRDFRRYINADLESLSIEFYLQRVQWALKCDIDEQHRHEAAENPSRHPCKMTGGFKEIVKQKNEGAYKYEQFLGGTLPIFVAIHNHLASINRALGNLYYYVTEVPFSSFTPTGKTEILHMTKELDRLMSGLLVATHLQQRFEWQADLLNYLVSCSSDCLRFLDSFPIYYQNHRMRLVIFPIDAVPDKHNPYLRENQVQNNLLGEDEELHSFPLTCVPWSAGTYLDFLDTYQSIVHHLRAVIVWSIRLFSVWHFVPRRYLRLIAPTRQ